MIASLPKEGEARPSRKDGEKLSLAQRILDYSAGPGAVTMKVVDVDSAFVGLYYRTVVLVSAKALALLDAEELTALVAHEMGHDADWDAYVFAMQAAQHGEDARAGAEGGRHRRPDPRASWHRSGAARVRHSEDVRYNDWLDHSAGATPQAAAAATANRYVPLSERLAFIRTIATLHWADRRPVPQAAAVQ